MTVKVCFRMSLAVSLFLLAGVSVANAQYSGGSGTADDPYQIATAADLIALGETPDDYDKHFILTADIDLDPNLPGRKVFDRAVIAPNLNPDDWWPFDGTPFLGTFDGRGHIILNLTMEGVHHLGLFGQIADGAEISNLGLVAVDIKGFSYFVGGLVGFSSAAVVGCDSTGNVTGTAYVGGLVGVADGGLIRRCHGNCVVSGSGDDSHHIGGLLGSNGDRGTTGAGIVTECFSEGTVNGGESGFVGGLMGGNFGSVSECYSTSTVNSEGAAWLVGGLMGSNMGIVTHCYSTGSVTGKPDPWSMVGGLIGGSGWYWPDSGSGCCGEVFDSFWDIQTSGQTASGGGTGLTTAQMMNQQMYVDAGWDFLGDAEDGLHEFWQMPAEGGYPVLSVFNGYTPPELQGTGSLEDPYLITDAVDLGAMGHQNTNAHYQLSTSVDLSGIRWGKAVIPVFGGTFDGNGLAISHLSITGGFDVGLFGVLTSSAEIRDLKVVDVNIAGSGYSVGGLAGDNSGTITSCCSTGSVSGDLMVGGLVGENAGNITASHSGGTVSGRGDVGGLAGWNDGGTITSCYSTGMVSGDSGVGGLLGYNFDGGSISASYSMGSVSGVDSIGGLVGSIYGGTITSCYSTGTVSGDSRVGGVTGRIFGGSIIAACYSTGSVTGNDGVGGLVGSNSSWQRSGEPIRSDVIQSFWDIETSGLTNMCGGQDDLSTGCDDSYGKATAEMQTASTFLEAGWDFIDETENGTDDIWWILEGQDYPRLWWELEEEDLEPTEN